MSPTASRAHHDILSPSRGFVREHLGVVEEGGDLVGREHVAHEHVAAGLEERAHVAVALLDVVHREGLGGVDAVQVDRAASYTGRPWNIARSAGSQRTNRSGLPRTVSTRPP